MTKFMYFAWVRERIGSHSEELEVPETVTTVRELLTWLAGRGEEYANALSDVDSLRVALDQTHAEADASIVGSREIAIFPPMTGG
ncbi:MAG: molybdopterin converting factor subunit 1 [Hyphomicrobiales bacterium]